MCPLGTSTAKARLASARTQPQPAFADGSSCSTCRATERSAALRWRAASRRDLRRGEHSLSQTRCVSSLLIALARQPRQLALLRHAHNVLHQRAGDAARSATRWSAPASATPAAPACRQIQKCSGAADAAGPCSAAPETPTSTPPHPPAPGTPICRPCSSGKGPAPGARPRSGSPPCGARPRASPTAAARGRASSAARRRWPGSSGHITPPVVLRHAPTPTQRSVARSNEPWSAVNAKCVSSSRASVLAADHLRASSSCRRFSTGS